MRFAHFHLGIDVEIYRHPQVCVLGKIERVGHHTDDFKRSSVEHDRFIKYGRISTEAFLPQRVTQDRDLVLPGLFVLECEPATKERCNTERLKVVSGYA